MSPFLGTRGAGSNRAFGYAGAAAPAQVTGLTATDFGTSRAYNNGRIDLSWTAPANNGATITGYLIERSTNGSSYSTLVANTGSSATTYSDTSLSSAQIYYYKVSAINVVGTGLASTAANATATTVPQAPTIGTATSSNSTTVSLSFTAGATGGKVISSYTAISSPSISLTTTGTSTPVTVTGTYAQGQAYTFTLTATNANGTSSASAASNSVTPSIPKPVVTGGTLTSDATYYYRTFTANGTLGVTNASLTADYLVVAGGGAGGGTNNFSDVKSASGWISGGSGGGAGGVLYSANYSFSPTNYSITIGAGGLGQPGQSAPGSGSNSVLGAIATATGGGRGGYILSTNTQFNGATGGSGGGGVGVYNTYGGGTLNTSGGTGTSGQGSTGGTGTATVGTGLPTVTPSRAAGGGGGGASGAGGNGSTSGTTNASLIGGIGGAPVTYFGSSYAGGGGGGCGADNSWSGSIRTSVGGGGGVGYNQNSAGGNGTANTGGGGGGAGAPNFNTATKYGGNGGSGVVVIRYTKAQVD